MKIGIPRSLYYYHYKDLWCSFFERLGIEVVVSEKTSREILQKGIEISNDEMCIALKNYLGHVASLKGKCDYVLVPRIDNYNIDNQTCTNYLSTYDIVHNLIDIPILNYNISLTEGKSEKEEFLKWSSILGKSKEEIDEAYLFAVEECERIKKSLEEANLEKLNSSKTKILVVSHPYNIFDSFIGGDLVKTLEDYDVEIIYSEYFDSSKSNELGEQLCNGLYFKYSKEEIGSISMCGDKADGVIFLTAFPCALDSLVIPLIMRKITIPSLQLIVDEKSSDTGLVTRVESFIDIIERNKVYE